MHLIKKRSARNSIITNGKRGTKSPLIEIEPTIVKLIIRLCRMRQSLSVGRCKSLVNSLIKGTEIQKKLIKRKKENSHTSGDVEKDGFVGNGYWNGFLDRNAHLLQTKKAEKYELNRAKWTTYRNICDMYKMTKKEMVEEARVAEYLEKPVWMNTKGEVVEEKDAVGCMVDTIITHPHLLTGKPLSCVLLFFPGKNLMILLRWVTMKQPN